MKMILPRCASVDVESDESFVSRIESLYCGFLPCALRLIDLCSFESINALFNWLLVVAVVVSLYFNMNRLMLIGSLFCCILDVVSLQSNLGGMI